MIQELSELPELAAELPTNFSPSQQYVESVAEPQYLEQYVVATTPPTSQTSKVSAYRQIVISVPKSNIMTLLVYCVCAPGGVQPGSPSAAEEPHDLCGAQQWPETGGDSC